MYTYNMYLTIYILLCYLSEFKIYDNVEQIFFDAHLNEFMLTLKKKFPIIFKRFYKMLDS